MSAVRHACHTQDNFSLIILAAKQHQDLYNNIHLCKNKHATHHTHAVYTTHRHTHITHNTQYHTYKLYTTHTHHIYHSQTYIPTTYHTNTIHYTTHTCIHIHTHTHLPHVAPTLHTTHTYSYISHTHTYHTHGVAVREEGVVGKCRPVRVFLPPPPPPQRKACRAPHLLTTPSPSYIYKHFPYSAGFHPIPRAVWEEHWRMCLCMGSEGLIPLFSFLSPGPREEQPGA